MNEKMNDKEMIEQLVYFLALIIVESSHRNSFRIHNGVESIINIMNQYQDDLSIVKYCCSCLNNSGPQMITLEMISEIEYVQQIYPFDFFLKTVLCACYANYAKVHSDLILQTESISWLVSLTKENIPFDLELSLLAAISNICRNSQLGQQECCQKKIHEYIINKMMKEEVNDEYWKIACNTLGCMSFTLFGNECNEIVKYAYRSGFVEKLIHYFYFIPEENESLHERVLSCLAKFCLIYPFFRIPSLHWLCYSSMMKQNIDNQNEKIEGMKQLYKLVPQELEKVFEKKTFVCYVCKSVCDPMVFRSVRYHQSIVLMSYCSLQCWFKRHSINDE